MSRLGKDKLASQLSISRQYISKLERLEDAEPPSLKVANEIASALGTCIYDIFDLDGTGNFKYDNCVCNN